MKTTVEIEEHRKNTTFDHYRQSSAQNIKINEIADDLKSGALLSTNYCFIDDENLKDLKKLLLQDQINLSIIIVNAINQAENVNGINLTSAIIDKIEYHFRMKEICVNQWYIDIFSNILIQSINNHFFIIWEWF